MKTIFLVTLLATLSSSSYAQTPPSITPKMCEQQGRLFVEERNTHESEPHHGRSWYWKFTASHYTHPHCYVMYDRIVSDDPPDSPVHSALMEIGIADVQVQDGGAVAWISINCVSKPNGRYECTKPNSTECRVNGKTCESMAEFNSLLGKFIPAFRNVNAK
jgi:hypothetical protein